MAHDELFLHFPHLESGNWQVDGRKILPSAPFRRRGVPTRRPRFFSMRRRSGEMAARYSSRYCQGAILHSSGTELSGIQSGEAHAINVFNWQILTKVP